MFHVEPWSDTTICAINSDKPNFGITVSRWGVLRNALLSRALFSEQVNCDNSDSDNDSLHVTDLKSENDNPRETVTTDAVDFFVDASDINFSNLQLKEDLLNLPNTDKDKMVNDKSQTSSDTKVDNKQQLEETQENPDVKTPKKSQSKQSISKKRNETSGKKDKLDKSLQGGKDAIQTSTPKKGKCDATGKQAKSKQSPKRSPSSSPKSVKSKAVNKEGKPQRRMRHSSGSPRRQVEKEKRIERPSNKLKTKPSVTDARRLSGQSTVSSPALERVKGPKSSSTPRTGGRSSPVRQSPRPSSAKTTRRQFRSPGGSKSKPFLLDKIENCIICDKDFKIGGRKHSDNIFAGDADILDDINIVMGFPLERKSVHSQKLCQNCFVKFKRSSETIAAAKQLRIKFMNGKARYIAAKKSNAPPDLHARPGKPTITTAIISNSCLICGMNFKAGGRKQTDNVFEDHLHMQITSVIGMQIEMENIHSQKLCQPCYRSIKQVLAGQEEAFQVRDQYMETKKKYTPIVLQDDRYPGEEDESEKDPVVVLYRWFLTPVYPRHTKPPPVPKNEVAPLAEHEKFDCLDDVKDIKFADDSETSSGVSIID